MMDITLKLHTAIKNLKETAESSFSTSYDENNKEVFVKADFDKMEWAQADGTMALTNPHSEITWTTIQTEMDRIQAEYDADLYARNRKKGYPSVEELVVALYDDEDKAAVDTKRAEVKAKYPKP